MDDAEHVPSCVPLDEAVASNQSIRFRYVLTWLEV